MTGFVYAIGDGEGRVKIGWSADPFRRLAKLRSDCSAAAGLLGVLPASRQQEAEAHVILNRWHIHGDWFRYEGPVAAFVGMLSKPGPRGISRSAAADAHPLRAYRAAARLTQNELAGLLGVSRVTVTRWESGARKIDDEKLPAVSAKTGIARTELRPDLAELMREAAE